MTNGAECIVETIDCRVPDSTRPSIWVMFQDPNIGHQWRREYSNLYNVQIQTTWTPIFEITRHFRLYRRNQVQVLRRQFPLRPAAIKKIHRCQGDTLDVTSFNKKTYALCWPKQTSESFKFAHLKLK